MRLEGWQLGIPRTTSRNHHSWNCVATGSVDGGTRDSGSNGLEEKRDKQAPSNGCIGKIFFFG